MIYVTVTTRNRFWHAACTAIALANANRERCFIHVFDDASDDAFSLDKVNLFSNLQSRGIIHRFEVSPARVGFCRGRELLIQRFFAESRFDYWLHLDDDILVAPQVFQEAVSNLKQDLENNALLHLYVNPWAKWTAWRGPYAKVSRIGGACYAVPKSVLEKIGNPYENETDGEKANAKFWAALTRAEIPNVIRILNPFLCQHTGNVESTIFGVTPTWEAMYAKNFKTGKLIEVPGFPMDGLRKAVKYRNLSSYAWKVNVAAKERVKLPAL